MKYAPTIFLRLSLLVLGAIILTLCFFVLPAIYREWPLEFPDADFLRYPVVLGLAVSAGAFWAALYQALKLLRYIDANSAFSLKSVEALRKIKLCALIITGLFATEMPAVYLIAENDDAPGLILLGLLFVGAALAVGVFAALMQRLLQNAIDIKSENDLTV